MRKLEQDVLAWVSPLAAWKLLEQFGSVDQWAPGMRSSSLSGELTSGLGVRREMRYRWGFRIEEEVTRWIDGQSMSFVLPDWLFVRFAVRREMRRGLKALIAFIGEDAPPTNPDYYPGVVDEQPIKQVSPGET